MGVLRVVNLGVEIDERRILRNVNLYIKPGETFVLFGPNGSGKSTLLNAIIGNPSYRVVSGRIMFKKIDVTNLPTNERVKLGMGIAFQTPPKISGVKLIDVLRYCAKIGGYTEDRIEEFAERMRMTDHLYREINVGFSGGEVKRSELLQLMLMNPDLILLDEPDSGVDLENVALIGEAINELLERDKNDDEREKSGIIITHQGHILDYVDADYAAILYKGQIACIGEPEDILHQIRSNGYEGCLAKCLKNMRNSE
ncbi:ABC transporter ATP-binding protein [Archaeoglobus neptunius]|uniref:ABC transporter ATP-binding protein n=1 Tax=Archaeoglobus neptunius TaxID=2798580 RepID=UPI0019281D9C|nr:ABC transporter ATP-binding protein [Archaeoglobus neptunius]